ncbi:DIP1984 family protein [Microbacterium gorillae]|uniref:DIP1984 family protein n=1 Tax=Microbacterium gorillae TaxID=1231063 RepID=UPI000591249B|nr:DIP1984 family protein [Microbacterium gorillae]
MKLAEALALRADLQRRLEQLRARIGTNARYQEGEEPTENAEALLGEADEVLTRLEGLIAAINRTNLSITLGERTMTDALARRDVLRWRHALLTSAADAAAGQGEFRQMRSELRRISALPVPRLRAQADEVARELRELDARIQEANWTNELRE